MSKHFIEQTTKHIFSQRRGLQTFSSAIFHFDLFWIFSQNATTAPLLNNVFMKKETFWKHFCFQSLFFFGCKLNKSIISGRKKRGWGLGNQAPGAHCWSELRWLVRVRWNCEDSVMRPATLFSGSRLASAAALLECERCFLLSFCTSWDLPLQLKETGGVLQLLCCDSGKHIRKSLWKNKPVFLSVCTNMRCPQNFSNKFHFQEIGGSCKTILVGTTNLVDLAHVSTVGQNYQTIKQVRCYFVDQF